MKKCEICNGLEWILKEKDGTTLAVRCECHEEKEIERLTSEAHIPPRYQNNRVNNYNAINSNQVIAKKAASNFIEEYPFIDYGLFFIGPCGVGKTHLATAILNEVIQNGYEGKFCDFGQLLVQIRSSYNPVSRFSEMEILSELFRSPLLVVDDFACQRVTDWVLETLTYIIKSLYNERRVLLLTTNINMQEMTTDLFFEQLTDRIGYQVTSRLYEMCHIIPIESADYRKEYASVYHKMQSKKKKT
ncbi:MAG: hypothetical protein A2Y62_00675 [Candidatus Fischerbacteria bacterium RBG_13_37_8]|uniref:IstB-like ATP-binding domain-containing protein n=1 Tax=Candidatus Fischerbacteria bacterium RBG_13_37_8 TaxID=1817863 RepID=A0A1F5VNJ5_9BACT|nr:MAG: hypothetical protein A2Y62_00675 [Candidatus Fischerbacteria bacterium RBG_13_37_8]